jgi:hypothetical protein
LTLKEIESYLDEPPEFSDDESLTMLTWKQIGEDKEEVLETQPYHCLKQVSCELLIGDTPDSLRGKLLSPFV